MTPLEYLYGAAVKKGQGALEKCFRDHAEQDFNDRPVFRVRKVEFTGGGMCHTITIKTGEDPSSPDLTVPNPLWGLGCDALVNLLGGKEMKTKRFRTHLEFVIRKLSGVVGVMVTRMDFQHIVGKKHVKKKRKRNQMDIFGLSDEEHEERNRRGPSQEWTK